MDMKRQAAQAHMDHLHAERVFYYRRMLEPTEVVHNTAVTLYIQLAESRGPAAGEGILLLTSAGLVWAAEQMAGGVRFPKTEIRNIEQLPCPRTWNGRPLGLRGRQRHLAQVLRFEMGGAEVAFMGPWPFATEAVRYLRGEPPSMLVSARQLVLGDDGKTSAMIAVIERQGGDPRFVSRIVPAPREARGDPEIQQILDNTYEMIIDQAFGELRVSLGLSPVVAYKWPRPIWMPKFQWDPPLPPRP